MPVCEYPRRRILAMHAAALASLTAAPSEAAEESPDPDRLPSALLADPVSKQHDTGERHPERPERFDAVLDALKSGGLLRKMLRIESRPALVDELLLCHGEEYVRAIEREIAAGVSKLSDGDTTVGEKSYDVALRAAGGVMNGVDAVLEGRARNAFCVVRPPGHHARPAQAMGFCIFNNVALAARYARSVHGVERVLVADWDVHHGNGTQDIFYEDPSVLFFSTHQSPWYPGTGDERETGAGAAKGTTMNRPFAAGAGREEILGAFRNRLLPAAREFRPDLVLVSAGFDSRRGDPLGGFTLSDEDFAELTRVMLEIADAYAGGRLVSVLEGGYNLSGLATAARSHAETLVEG